MIKAKNGRLNLSSKCANVAVKIKIYERKRSRRVVI